MHLLLPLLALTACRSSEPPADLVVVLVDTLRADGPSFAGNPHPTTPFLDRLVQDEAMWFSRAYAGSSWTLSSTATLLTGQYPWQHGVVRAADQPDVYGRLPAQVPTLPSVYGARGYRSAAFVNNAFLAPEFGLGKHFDLYDYEGASIDQHRTALETVTLALDWLKGSEQPAVLLVHMMEPHFEYIAPESVRGTFSKDLPHQLQAEQLGPLQISMMNGKTVPSDQDKVWIRAMYDEEVLAVDQAVEQLVAGLKEQGRWKNTRLVVTSDHGEELWDYGRFEHGHSTRSAVTHVPLVIKAPGGRTGRNNTVLDHVSLHRWMAEGAGVLASALTTGADQPGGVAMGQDILYGPQEVTAVNWDTRIVARLATQQLSLWDVDADGVEGRPLHDDPTEKERWRAPFEVLQQHRGHMNPTVPTNPRTIEDQETFDLLRQLGYIH